MDSRFQAFLWQQIYFLHPCLISVVSRVLIESQVCLQSGRFWKATVNKGPRRSDFVSPQINYTDTERQQYMARYWLNLSCQNLCYLYVNWRYFKHVLKNKKMSHYSSLIFHILFIFIFRREKKSLMSALEFSADEAQKNLWGSVVFLAFRPSAQWYPGLFPAS